MTVNAVLVALLVALGAWEVAAGLIVPASAMTTVSEYVWRFERWGGLPARLGVALAVAALLLHLVLAWPLGPAR